MFQRNLSADRIDAIVRDALEHAEAEEFERAWDVVQPLLKAQGSQLPAAEALAHLLEQGAFDRENGLECARAIFDAHQDDPGLIAEIADGLELVHDINFLNAAPPSDPLFANVANYLCSVADKLDGGEDLPRILSGLGTVARLLGRTWDDVAERTYLRRVEISPDQWNCQYRLGLFYKTRGRFTDGQAANQRAFDVGGSDRESVQWNLGICATGARDGRTALKIWQGLDLDIGMGRFNLPEGKFSMVKVRLAQRPLAARNPAAEPDDPGDEETVWVERLSPCHGIIVSALYYDSIGVDFGDVVLFDGAPITHHTYGDKKVPVFPHLATLVKGDYRIVRFAGTQQREKQIGDLSKAFPHDAVFYVHDEQFAMLCTSCWNNPDLDHAEHGKAEHRVVTGKLCAPPSMTAEELLETVDQILAANLGVRLFIPDLAEQAGDHERAMVERRRKEMLVANA